MTSLRIVVSIPFILGGRAVTNIGYAIADARHLNPHRRPS